MSEQCKFANPCELKYVVQRLEVMNVFLQADSTCSFWRDTESFTSCDFTHVNTYFVTDSFSFSCPFSSSVKPNCSHHRNAELIHRMNKNKSSVFEASALTCMVSLPFFFFRISRLKALRILDDLCLWIFPPSHWLWNPTFLSGVIGRVPHHFFSSPGPRNVQCPCKNLFS